MNCIFSRSRMSCYVDGELSGDEMIAMRRHVEACPDCHKLLEKERGLKRMLSTLPTCETSDEFEERLLSAVRNSQTSTTAENWPTGRMALALALAAVLVFCVFSLRKTDSPAQPRVGNEIALDQDWNNARSVFPASNLPAGLEGP
jgi:anti-sigma factor RsiW